MTRISQNTNVADTLVGYSIQFNNSMWPSAASNLHFQSNKVTINSKFASKVDWFTETETDSADYQVCDFRLEANATVGPSQQGIFLTSTTFGSQLFLSDPSLPPNVWAGPIKYALLISGANAVGVLALNAGTSWDETGDLLQSDKWPFLADPFDLMGILLRGDQSAFLTAPTSLGAGAFNNLFDCSTIASEDRKPVVGYLPGPSFFGDSRPDVGDSRSDISESSPLARTIRAAHKRAMLESDAAETAQRAVDDACAFVERAIPSYKPAVMLSDDGAVLLQWRKADLGVLLIFTGDGTANFSLKEPGGRYTSGGDEFSIADGLPTEVKAAIDRVVAS
jgi:hypothetical protein